MSKCCAAVCVVCLIVCAMSTLSGCDKATPDTTTSHDRDVQAAHDHIERLNRENAQEDADRAKRVQERDDAIDRYLSRP